MEDLLQLQKERDTLRSTLRGQLKLGQDTKSTLKLLTHLDSLFFRLCTSRGLTLSKFGRLLSS